MIGLLETFIVGIILGVVVSTIISQNAITSLLEDIRDMKKMVHHLSIQNLFLRKGEGKVSEQEVLDLVFKKPSSPDSEGKSYFSKEE